ncbi:MAG: V-type ATP synthase subunit B [Synergistaceae bacterium]|jgi:V/A-type H+-transporting ATPase subunit B|nr:V-type ATP synthase subunit B [Synergistaceae bacterium]
MTWLYREGSKKITGVSGSLLFAEARGAGIGEPVTVETDAGALMGQVLHVEGALCAVQLFDEMESLARATLWLERGVLEVGVGDGLLGRVLDGRGRPVGEGVSGRSGGIEKFVSLYGPRINPAHRTPPGEAIETGLSALDLMSTLMRGQKILLLAGAGLPTAELAAHAAVQATVRSRENVLVFAGIGIPARDEALFMDAFERGGVMESSVCLLNRAGDSPMERFLTPRAALAVAEYFAFEKGRDVFVVVTDMLNYCDALRDLNRAIYKTPEKEYPARVYSDLAGIYERAGCAADRPGSVTQLSVLTLPDDDLSHPAALLSAAVADGQIILDRALHARGVFPPVDIAASLSRLMNRGIGRGRTFDSHRDLAGQLHAAWAKAMKVKRLPAGSVLSSVERTYIDFADAFECRFLNQRVRETAELLSVERRTFAQSEARAWEILSKLPPEELYLLPSALLERKRWS